MPSEKEIGEDVSDIKKGAGSGNLKQASIRSGTITVGVQGLSILIQLTSTVVLARMLSPEDYGVIAMVTGVTAFAALFRDLGLSSAAIQKAELSHAQQSNLFWLNVLMGLLLTVVVAAASPLVAAFYKKPELTAVTFALSATFLIGSLGTQPGAMMVRRMQFGRKAVATIAGSVITLIVAVTFALRGASYWSLVYGTLAGSLATTALLFLLSPFHPGMPGRKTGVRGMLRFGAHITAFDLVNYFSRNLDNILIGKFWGTDAVGIYSKAYSLLMFPINAMRGPINAVAFPAMSRLQNDPKSYRRYYRNVVSLLAAASMPVTAFLFLTSDSIVEITLGKKWAAVSPLFSILAVAGFIQPPASLIGLVSLSRGRSKVYLRVGVFSTVVTCVGFLCGIHWGALGVAWSYVITRYIVVWPSLNWSFKDTPVLMGDFLEAIKYPGISSLIAVLIVYQLQNLITVSAIHELLLCAPLFVLIYSVSLIIFTKGAHPAVLLVKDSALPLQKRIACLLRRKSLPSS